MRRGLQSRIARLASDRESGASEILDEALAIIREAFGNSGDLLEVVRAIVRAQPAMASIWNAAVVALASDNGSERFEQFARRVARAPDALARFALDCLINGQPDVAPIRIATISYSRTVLHVLKAIGQVRPLHVACTESRPAAEGRRLASQLVATGIGVTFFGDAAIGHALATADAVLVGADAVTPAAVVNKSGTQMLAAAAMQQGVPVYVVASRDKFVTTGIAARLGLREGPPSDVWDEAPPGVTVRNPYFEATSINLVTSLITDVGVVGPDSLAELCASTAHGVPPGTLELL